MVLTCVVSRPWSPTTAPAAHSAWTEPVRYVEHQHHSPNRSLACNTLDTAPELLYANLLGKTPPQPRIHTCDTDSESPPIQT